MKRLAPLFAFALCVGAPLAARAYDGIVVADVNLRAGPDVGYPAITVLPAGAPVAIEGCIDGWSWCDVVVGPDHGWIAGDYLQNDYGGQRVFINDYGARIGIPIVAFSLGAYWGHYYTHRPWYHDRDRWERRHFSYRAPPRPHVYAHAFDHRGPRYHGGRAHGSHYDGAYGHRGSTHMSHPINRGPARTAGRGRVAPAHIAPVRHGTPVQHGAAMHRATSPASHRNAPAVRRGAPAAHRSAPAHAGPRGGHGGGHDGHDRH